MLMGVVDNYLVAQVGLIAVSGVSVANNIITIYQAILLLLVQQCLVWCLKVLVKRILKVTALSVRSLLIAET